MKIFTIQHTQSEQHKNGMIGSLGDWGLTETGIEQAKRIAERLSNEVGNEKYVIYSSDLRRASQTAEILLNRLGFEIVTSPLLREFDLGEANGKTKAWARENLKCPVFEGTRDWAIDIDGRVFKNAETKREVAERVTRFINEILLPSGENAIIVSHDGTLSIFYAMWIGLDTDMLNRVNLSGKSGGVSLLRTDADGHRIISRLNDMSFVKE